MACNPQQSHSYRLTSIVILLILFLTFVSTAYRCRRHASVVEILSPGLTPVMTDRISAAAAATPARLSARPAGSARSPALQRRSDTGFPRRDEKGGTTRREQQQQSQRPAKTTEQKIASDATKPAKPAHAGEEQHRQPAQRSSGRPRNPGSRAAHKHNTLRAVTRAFAAHPRWLGAFRELATRSNQHREVVAAVRQFLDDASSHRNALPADLQARLDDARWAAGMRYRVSRIVARLVAAGVLPSGLNDDALSPQPQPPRNALDHARNNWATTQLDEWVRELDGIAREVEQRLPRDADGRPVKTLQEMGEEVLAAEAAQKQPAALPQSVLAPPGGAVAVAAGAGPTLVGSMPWAQAAEVLAAEAARLESSTGATWLLAGASQEEKTRFLRQSGSLWTALQNLRQGAGSSPPLTDLMLQRLQEEIDRAYTQCVVDMYPETDVYRCRKLWTYHHGYHKIKPRQMVLYKERFKHLEEAKKAYADCMQQGRSEAECEEAGTLTINGIVYRPHPEQHRQQQGLAASGNDDRPSGMSPMAIHQVVKDRARHTARVLAKGFAEELGRTWANPTGLFALWARRGAVGGARAPIVRPRS